MKSHTSRPLTALLAFLMLTIVTAAPTAHAAGVTKEQLEAHGWVCVPFAPAGRFSCFNPGLGRPSPTTPVEERAPSYSFVAFSMADGSLIGVGHLTRSDLYAGQPCGSSGAYVERAAIGYHECVRPRGG